MNYILKMSFRNLARNKRRSFFSALAVAIGTALLLFMSATMRGEMRGSLDLTINLRTGHLQIHTEDYKDENMSLKRVDMIEAPLDISKQIEDIAQVKAASPRLNASGIIAFKNETIGIQIIGIDPSSAANIIYQEGLVEGEYLRADDREGVLIGLPLAESLNMKPGDTIDLIINTSEGETDEQRFTVRGIYTTDTPGYDKATIFMPLEKAQTITRTENYASMIYILLHEMDDTAAVKEAIQAPGYIVEDWEEMNKLIILVEKLSNAMMFFFNLMVLGVTSTVIMNTLLMAVYERTREMGILGALGMKAKQVKALFLTEATLLAIGGVLVGLAIGVPLVLYYAQVGFFFGDMGISGGSSFMIGNSIYPYPTFGDVISVSIAALLITILSGYYPASQAAKLEPVDALHSNN
ncbi:MAG: ABC transporter permease [Anaerolineae bacterium]|jgi:ABC-type lipoprotein release transport system permease subunit|nr:ABC transporter permease [Anaerolineae bacterium]MBT7069902.1 ABC transporter permease [Anaerolineae bacterium]MBT7323867.1 ABC transporter permease [Anaerolineae bacterium]